MKSRKKFRLGTTAAIATTVMSAVCGCNSTGCIENRNSVPLAKFYSSSDQSPITLDSVEVYGLGMTASKPLSAAGVRISSLYLPMRSTQQSTAWVFAYRWKRLDRPELYDTITFDYESTPYFASTDCGVIYRYKINRMTSTHHLMDSVVIADSLITNIDIERIKIYFRTNDNSDAQQ